MVGWRLFLTSSMGFGVGGWVGESYCKAWVQPTCKLMVDRVALECTLLLQVC
jgi:hypothetical protein